MKKIIASLILTLVTTVSFAQTNTKTDSSAHLIFKGVPIDGTLNEYVSKMKQNGFTLIDTEDGVAMLKGDFATYKDCIIGVATLKQRDLVSKITVIFPECDTWSSLESNYTSLQEMLTEKYSKPSENVEEFQTNLKPKDDALKMIYLRSDQCKYYTTYETDKGRIQLSIEHNRARGCVVMLAYYDKINGDIIKTDAMNDL